MMSSVAVLLVLLAHGHALRLAREECSSSGDCLQDKVCAANLCEDPCPSFCGENTVCQVKWHTPICRCRQGYNGDPMQGCTESVIHECSFNGDCPLDKACESHKCEDPCIGFCGNNTVCQVKRHVPVCRCLQGFIGEPMMGGTYSDCSPDNTRKGTGKKKYEVSSYKLNWFEAFNNCHFRGKRMATFDTKEDFDELVTEIKAELPNEEEVVVWIGANDLGRQGNYVWMNTGQPLMGYRKWHVGEPNNLGGNEDCLHLWNRSGVFAMNDWICAKENFFACEYQH